MTWKRTVLIGAGAVAALVITVGCTNEGSGTEQQVGQSPSASATTAPRSRDHNNADVWFVRHMIPHHQQAIEMSDIVLAKQGIDPRVTDLATKIKAAQGPEITQMQDWLTQWGIQSMPSMGPGGGMPGHENMPGMSGGMMGMLSTEQVTALKNAQGVEAAKLFLTGMIGHHEGAIAMAQNEIEGGLFPTELELSRSIVKSQQQEIDIMRAILATL
jgi:uncharacterized protein (DUF305 family)